MVFKIVMIELDLHVDTPKIHVYTTPTFTLTFCSWVIIWKPQFRNSKHKKGLNSGKNYKKNIVITERDLDTHIMT